MATTGNFICKRVVVWGQECVFRLAVLTKVMIISEKQEFYWELKLGCVTDVYADISRERVTKK